MSIQLSFDEDDEDSASRSALWASKSRDKVSFKRIKKEDAIKLKTEAIDVRIGDQKSKEDQLGGDDEAREPKVMASVTKFEMPPVSYEHKSILEELAQRERQWKDEAAGAQSPSSSLSDREVDRDWYMQDERVNHVYMDDYDMDDEDRVSKIDEDDLEEVSNDIDIHVHRLTPPFLDSHTVMSNHTGMIDVIRDRTGDLFKFSKNGSSVVNERRKNRDRQRNARESVRSDNSALEKVVRKGSNGTRHDGRGTRTNPPPRYSRADIQRQRQALPAYKVREQFLKVVRENQVVVVIGETGSGKTTQLPQFLYGEGYKERGLIGITQPRRVAAVSVAQRVSEEMNVKLGEEVGFSIRFEDRSSSKTRIKFMTDGILLRETLQDEDLDKYSCIIMDEAHERSLNTDILIGLFKKLLARRRDLKLIVTSATLNADKFSSFFGNAEQFIIPGRTYPVDIMFSSVPVMDYVEEAVKQVLRVHLSAENKGDILVFMTGQEDIEVTCSQIEEELDNLRKLDETIKPLQVLPIYSTLPADLQARIFERSEYRKCIVATNIAETSLTVDGIGFVIDTGLMKLKVYNARLSMESLQITPISLAQANQRAGRAGRTGPGTCYRLYTLTAAQTEMLPEPIPEIQRTNLENTILLLKSLKVKDLSRFPFLDRPSIESISTAQYQLWSEGALDNFGDLTLLGERMSRFPIEPTLSKFLILSTLDRFHCSKEVVTIVAMLSIPPIFVRPNNDMGLQKKSDSSREKFQVAESDHLTLLNIYDQFMSHGRNEKWCQHNFLQHKSLRRASEIREQLVQIMKNNKLDLTVQDCEDWNLIRECVCAAFFLNGASFKKYGQYQHLRSGLEMALHPTSALYGMGDLPKYVVYHEVILSGRVQHMNYVSTVKGEWLIEYGGVFYSKRVRGVSSKEHQRRKETEYEEYLQASKK
ncbi:hypothetical protein FOA43_003180 [Brettanomyces nanus]|uniref:RNA helicase n=1 Tax=Eeniella nana TaxID=13502 RepID=A0A875S4E1_EENNA|nr:uncharacterized protein FOA43_003180 [Brettanomyces nanus]QPG75818.1 hypothetical protein FOA43_003180 [Brettanomyces nanus]